MTSDEQLPWDSQFFGFGVASLGSAPLDRDQLRTALAGLRRQGVRLVYWGPPAGEPASERAGRAEHGRLVDRKTTYALDLATVKRWPAAAPVVTPYEGRESTPELERLAIQSGRLSRFAVDPEIPRERFEELYRLWLRNSLSGELAHAVLVARRGEGVVGMVTLVAAEDHGSIGLIAVDQIARGLGLGSALVESALRWGRDRGLPEIRVVTQGDNLPACQLYEKHGFRPTAVQNFFHFWL
jgi:dTDP-4-amino-4,6-dideoxy-D-galactose acyltransferase